MIQVVSLPAFFAVLFYLFISPIALVAKELNGLEFRFGSDFINASMTSSSGTLGAFSGSGFATSIHGYWLELENIRSNFYLGYSSSSMNDTFRLAGTREVVEQSGLFYGLEGAYRWFYGFGGISSFSVREALISDSPAYSSIALNSSHYGAGVRVRLNRLGVFASYQASSASFSNSTTRSGQYFDSGIRLGLAYIVGESVGSSIKKLFHK